MTIITQANKKNTCKSLKKKKKVFANPNKSSTFAPD